MQSHLAALADESASSSVRREAALAIGALRDTATPADVEHVLRLLGSTHDCEVGGGAISVRRAALLAFTELARGTDGGGVPTAVASNVELLSTLTRARDDEAQREMALRAMAVLGAHADAHSVVARLEDSHEDVRCAAADTLVVLREVLTVAHIELILVCMPSDIALAAEADEGEETTMAERRALVLQTLAGIAAAAAWQDHAAFTSAVTTAAACLADEAAATRAAALAALAAFGPRASAAHVDAVAALLEDEDAPVRLAAVDALGRLGSADNHGEALSELLGDRDRGVRSAATTALKQWGLA